MNKGLYWLLLVMMTAAGHVHAYEWGIRRFDGRDYVSIEKVGAFYNLPTDAAVENKSIYMNRSLRSLRVSKDSRDVEINGVKFILSFPVIEREGKYWLSRMDLGKTIEPAFRPEMIPGVKKFTTVVIDPGHGGHDKGATGPYEYEKNFALDVSRRVRNELQKAGVTVLLTRNNDSFVELHERAAIANAKQECIFVSIHFNASSNLAATGLEVFCITPRGSPSTEYDELRVRDMVQEYGNENEVQSFSLASAINHSLQGSTLSMFDRGVKRARFAVLRLTKMPAVLIEGGFLSNSHDSKAIANKDWRDKYAKAIATGILEYRKLAELKRAPRTVAEYRSPSLSPPQAPPPPSAGPTPGRPSISLSDLPSEPMN